MCVDNVDSLNLNFVMDVYCEIGQINKLKQVKLKCSIHEIGANDFEFSEVFFFICLQYVVDDVFHKYCSFS